MLDYEFVKLLKTTDNQDELQAIEDLYEYLDPILDSSDFIRIENLIKLVINIDLSIRVLIGFLTITHSTRDKIKTRPNLIEAVKNKGANKFTEEQIKNILRGF